MTADPSSTVDIAGPGDAAARTAYERLFAECPEAFIQQSTAWGDAIGRIGPDEPIYLVCRAAGRAVAGLPLYLFRGPSGNLMSSVPQAGPLGGIFCLPGSSTGERRSAYRSLLESADELARQHDCVALSIITNPFAPDVALYREAMKPSLEFENFTQAVAVSSIVVDGAVIQPKTDKRLNIRRNLRRAHEAGLRAGTCETADDFDAWYDIHARRHSELGVQPLGRDLLRNLLTGLEPLGKAFVMLARLEARIVAGCLYVMNRDVCDAFMMSMHSDYSKTAANYFVTEQALLEMSRRGVGRFNWQSSESRSSGVYAFKKQWGSEESVYSFVTKLYRERRFFLDLGIDRLKTDFRGHYVVPFGIFAGDPDATFFRKS